MKAYRKERIDNAIAFFVHEHYHKTKKPLSQTKLWKYLAYFEISMVKKTGVPPLELKYTAWEYGPVPVALRKAIVENKYIPEAVKTEINKKNSKTYITFSPDKKSNYELDYFSENEIEEMFHLVDIFADIFVTASDMSESSHRDFKSWKKAWDRKGDKKCSPMDISEEFSDDIRSKDENELKLPEENYLAFESLSRA